MITKTWKQSVLKSPRLNKSTHTLQKIAEKFIKSDQPVCAQRQTYIFQQLYKLRNAIAFALHIF